MEIIRSGSYGKLYYDFATGKNAVEGSIGLILSGDVIEIEELQIIGGWLPIQIRPCQKVVIGKLTTVDYMNDGIHICSSNVYVGEFDTYSTLPKVYSRKNHPDLMQIFPWRGEKKIIENVDVPVVNAYVRNSKEHAGIHLTEDCDYRNLKIGYEKMSVDTDSDYPYFLSANSMRDSLVGHSGMNVSGKGIRIMDVKHTGQPIGNIDVYGVDEENVYVKRKEEVNVYV